MSVLIAFINDIAVSLFGSILSASFCGALGTRKNRIVFWSFLAVFSAMQGVIYSFWDAAVMRNVYPLVMHLPLMITLAFITRKLLWSVISVLSAYLSCQLRRWVALLLVALFSGGDVMQDVFELILTVPFLLILLRFAAPAVRRLSDYPAATQLLFGVIPAVYYVFDYLTVVYTNLLTSGSPVVVEFMPFVCCAAYLVFLLYHSAEEQKRSRFQQVQKNLNLQLAQAVREVDALRESQAMASRYRHDLRHHLQYLSSCIENGQAEKAQEYIFEICKEIEAHKVQRYCENEAANLILSSFATRAEKRGIRMNVQGSIPAFLVISDNDLCVILSNSLENAVHACVPLAAAGKDCIIDVQFYERENKLFLQISNPCDDSVRFQDDVPVTDKPGHGIGVQSICAIVRRYGGVYSFSIQNGKFILRMSL